MQEAALSSALYNNLTFYHLKSKTSQSLNKAAEYVEGAVIANREMERNEVNLAISLNNKAVIELKRNNKEIAHDLSLKSVELIESRVFGMINSKLLDNHKELF